MAAGNAYREHGNTILYAFKNKTQIFVCFVYINAFRLWVIASICEFWVTFAVQPTSHLYICGLCL